MPLSFTVIETTSTQLWDFGWFDHTRFSVDGSATERSSSRDVVRALLRDAIFQRSFCTHPDPWGESVGRHGPFLTKSFEADWFEPVSPDEFQRRVERALARPGFTEPPSSDQRLIVDAWASAVQHRRDDAFALNAPVRPDVRVEFAYIWYVFDEFICVSRDRDELTVAVVGYD